MHDTSHILHSSHTLSSLDSATGQATASLKKPHTRALCLLIPASISLGASPVCTEHKRPLLLVSPFFLSLHPQ
ncbi:hypothetical protein VTN77DRAFT_5798 [Rasamsonia byssochlamydoides]|uniref:uncharacterized protein n=1 Tax=Rasamsonia byssochlamydoides TaxID=89139 RepID=UPI0037421BE7